MFIMHYFNDVFGLIHIECVLLIQLHSEFLSFLAICIPYFTISFIYQKLIIDDNFYFISLNNAQLFEELSMLSKFHFNYILIWDVFHASVVAPMLLNSGILDAYVRQRQGIGQPHYS